MAGSLPAANSSTFSIAFKLLLSQNQKLPLACCYYWRINVDHPQVIHTVFFSFKSNSLPLNNSNLCFYIFASVLAMGLTSFSTKAFDHQFQHISPSQNSPHHRGRTATRRTQFTWPFLFAFFEKYPSAPQRASIQRGNKKGTHERVRGVDSIFFAVPRLCERHTCVAERQY